MSHRFHPNRDIDAEDAILFDDCDDCKQKAKGPAFHLGTEKVEALWNRMLAVELDDEGEYRSLNERDACMVLWHTYILMERHLVPYQQLNPRELVFRPYLT